MPAHKRAGRGRHVPAPGKPVRPPPHIPWGIASLLIVCFLFQCLAGMTAQSATYDEPVYIAAGYSYLETGDFRLKRDAPPLVATLGGVALRLGTLLRQ
jgi:hypothetical protein